MVKYGRYTHSGVISSMVQWGANCSVGVRSWGYQPQDNKYIGLCGNYLPPFVEPSFEEEQTQGTAFTTTPVEEQPQQTYHVAHLGRNDGDQDEE